jgi:hypothetical protein
MDDNFVEELRGISARMEATPDAATHLVLFPGWDEEWPEEPEPRIKRVARAILAEGVPPDEGTKVSYQELSALIHYLADMME